MRDKSQKSISKIWPGSKWYITCHGCCLIWGPKLFSPCQIPLFSIDFWNVQWAIPPSVPWRLVAHFVTTVLICFSLKAKTNTSKTHSLAADVTISPSFPQSHHLYTSPQLSTDIRALWSTDALVFIIYGLTLLHNWLKDFGDCLMENLAEKAGQMQWSSKTC